MLAMQQIQSLPRFQSLRAGLGKGSTCLSAVDIFSSVHLDPWRIVHFLDKLFFQLFVESQVYPTAALTSSRGSAPLNYLGKRAAPKVQVAMFAGYKVSFLNC